MADPLKLVGKRIAGYRRDAGMTQVQLAKRVNYTKDAISRIERGAASKVAFLVLADIAQALGVEIIMLFSDKKKRRDIHETDRRRARLLMQIDAALRRRSTREIEAARNVVQEFLYALGKAGRPPAHRGGGRTSKETYPERRAREIAEFLERQKQKPRRKPT